VRAGATGASQTIVRGAAGVVPTSAWSSLFGVSSIVMRRRFAGGRFVASSMYLPMDGGQSLRFDADRPKCR